MTTTVSVSEELPENYQRILYFPVALQLMLTALMVSILAIAGVGKK